MVTRRLPSGHSAGERTEGAADGQGRGRVDKCAANLHWRRTEKQPREVCGVSMVGLLAVGKGTESDTDGVY